MVGIAQLVGAGVVGFITLKLLGLLAAPLLGLFAGLAGLTVGIVGFVLKVAFVVLVGWLVLRLFRRRPAHAA